jgi:hypothetical protein
MQHALDNDAVKSGWARRPEDLPNGIAELAGIGLKERDGVAVRPLVFRPRKQAALPRERPGNADRLRCEIQTNRPTPTGAVNVRSAKTEQQRPNPTPQIQNVYPGGDG